MNLINSIIKSVKELCNNDEICIMIVFILVGFMLCYLFKNQISGYINFGSPIEEVKNNENNLVGNNLVGNKINQNNQQQIGIELKKRKPEPTPSTERQLKVMASKPQVNVGQVGNQLPGLSVQDSMMFRPFDEIWNPGFMPLDMVFKDVQKLPLPSLKGPTGPTGTKVGGDDLKVVLVYAPWCGHSKKMLPDYERVKSEFHGQNVNGKNISILMYNSDVDKDKVKEYGVKGFPTLFVEKNGVRESFPHRTYDKIVEYIKGS